MSSYPRVFELCILVLLGLGLIAAAPVTDPDLRELWEQGDLSRMERLAEAGDVRAQRWMGLMLHNRGGYDEAIEWYVRAVEQGDGSSASNIAFFYENGIGRPKDFAEATLWYAKGAALGDFSSQLRYAAALRSGVGLARDEREAFKWYAKAAMQPGIEQAGYAYLPVAEMLEQGSAVPQDLKRAYAFAKAAELTVDSSDFDNQVKAASLKADVTARLKPAELEEAEQLFVKFRPDLAQRSRSPSRFALLLLVVFAGGFGWWLLRRRSRRSGR